jgi:hypothetical protein
MHDHTKKTGTSLDWERSITAEEATGAAELTRSTG